jgi:hypothetical protein
LAINGSNTGPLYGLGLIVVAAAGTPVLLSAGGASLTNGFGTAASPSPIVCSQIRVKALSSNAGLFYLLFKGGNKAVPLTVALAVEPGRTETLWVPGLSNNFELQAYTADADTSGNSAFIVAVIV